MMCCSVSSFWLLLIEELRGLLRLRGHHPAALIHQLGAAEGGHTRLFPLWFKAQPMDPDWSRPLPQTAVKGQEVTQRV